MSKYETHDFYCISCGKAGIPIARPKSKQRERLHKKKLWCNYCKKEVNHIECKNYYDVLEFKENFENGVYNDEEELVFDGRNTWIG